ncbi:MAG TPA: TetR/AcrR family transcriptional regulator [Sporichthyaceae bacterium]|jgi:AcrR family transcriptional regulator
MAAMANGSAAGASNRSVVPEAIVRESIRLFAEHSYPVVGMRDLSKAVGLQPGSLYAHISSKEDLLMLIVEEGITNYIDAISAAIDTDEPADVRLRAAIHAHMRVLADTLEQTKVTFNQWRYLGPENRERVVGLRHQYEDLFFSVTAQGIKNGELRPLPHLKASLLSVIGGLNFAAEWYSPDKPETPESLGDAIADLLLEGIVTTRRTTPTRRARR